jgi:hypothetical protein
MATVTSDAVPAVADAPDLVLSLSKQGWEEAC